MNDILFQKIRYAFGSCFRSVVGRVLWYRSFGTGVTISLSQDMVLAHRWTPVKLATLLPT